MHPVKGDEHNNEHSTTNMTNNDTILCTEVSNVVNNITLKMLRRQSRSHQIWSDQVGSARARTLYPRGALGHAPPGKFLNLGAMRLLRRPILANTMLIGGQTTEFHMNAILTTASYTNDAGFHIPVCL